MEYTLIAKLLTKWYKVEQYFLKLFNLTTAQQIQIFVDANLPDPTDKKKHLLYKQILTNVAIAQSYSDYSSFYDERFSKFKERTKYVENKCRLITIAKNALDKIYEPTHTLLGIQPMSAPVGLTYFMQFKDKEVTEKGTTQKLEIVSVAGEAHSRKLNARFNIESMQDVKNLHQLDVEAEIIAAVSDIVAFDIFNETLAKLRSVAPTPTEFVLDPIDIDAGIKLVTMINKAANEIGSSTNRGVGNVIVINPLILALLQVATTKHSVLSDVIKLKDKSEISSCNFPQVVTQPDSQYQVIVDLGMENDDIIVAYNGKGGEVDCGVAYCPYVLLSETGVQVDPETFQPARGFLTRRGYVENNNPSGYYRVIKVKDKKDETN